MLDVMEELRAVAVEGEAQDLPAVMLEGAVAVAMLEMMRHLLLGLVVVAHEELMVQNLEAPLEVWEQVREVAEVEVRLGLERGY